jgi:hypothetical protein
MADIFSYLSGGLGKGVLSGDHIIDGVLDLAALPFELLGFLIPTMKVPIASSLASSGGGITIVTSSSGRGTRPAGIAQHPFQMKRKVVVRKC